MTTAEQDLFSIITPVTYNVDFTPQGTVVVLLNAAGQPVATGQANLARKDTPDETVGALYALGRAHAALAENLALLASELDHNRSRTRVLTTR